MRRWAVFCGVAMLAASCAGAGDGSPAAETTAPAPASTPTTSGAATSITPTTTVPAPAAAELPFDDNVDLRGFAMAADHSGTGFIAIADHADAGPVIWRSDDGLEWRSSPIAHNLPDGVRGPYRLWRLGNEYLLYAVIETDGSLLGEEPLVAASEDAFKWRLIETRGIDTFFWQNDWTPPQPGGVTSSGSVGLFTGTDTLPDGTPNAVIYRIRPNETVELIDNPLQARDSVAVDGAVLGIAWTEPRQWAIARFDGTSWKLSVELDTAVDLRVVGDRVLALTQALTLFSDDGGETWTQAEALSSDIRQFAWFGEHGAAGEVHPPFGTPETFPMSLDGVKWWDQPLPENVVDIRHLMTTAHGLFSVVRYAGRGDRAVVFTEF